MQHLVGKKIISINANSRMSSSLFAKPQVYHFSPYLYPLHCILLQMQQIHSLLGTAPDRSIFPENRLFILKKIIIMAAKLCSL